MWLTDKMFGLNKAPVLPEREFEEEFIEDLPPPIGEMTFRLNVDGEIDIQDMWYIKSNEDALSYAQFLHAIHKGRLIQLHAQSLLNMMKFNPENTSFVKEVLKNWYILIEEEGSHPMVQPSNIPVFGVQQ